MNKFTYNGIVITTGDYRGRKAKPIALFSGAAINEPGRRQLLQKDGVVDSVDRNYIDGEMIRLRSNDVSTPKWFSRYELYFDGDTRPVYWRDIKIGERYYCAFSILTWGVSPGGVPFWPYEYGYDPEDVNSPVSIIGTLGAVTATGISGANRNVEDMVIECISDEDDNSKIVVPWTTIFPLRIHNYNQQRLVYEFNEWNKKNNKKRK